MGWVVKIEQLKCEECAWAARRKRPGACPRCGSDQLAATGPAAYKASYRDPEGTILSQTFARIGEARTFLAGQTVDTARGVYLDPRLGRTTVAAFWPKFLEASPHLRPATTEVYGVLSRLHVLPYLGRRRLGELTRLDIERWVGELTAAGVGAATVNAAHRVLRRVLSAAEAAGYIGRNVARGVKTPRPPREEMRFLDATELSSIVEAVPDNDRALVLLLGLCGLRIGEAAALAVEDLDLLRRTARVTKAVSEVAGRVTVGPTKTGASRAVPLPRVVAEALAAHLSAVPKGPRGLVFGDRDGGFLRRTNWTRRVWRPALRKAGIAEPLPRVHDLRHTAASLAIAAGAHPKSIQAALGHSSITVTLDRYGHLFPSLAESLAERVDDAFREARAAFLLPFAASEVEPGSGSGAGNLA